MLEVLSGDVRSGNTISEKACEKKEIFMFLHVILPELSREHFEFINKVLNSVREYL